MAYIKSQTVAEIRNEIKKTLTSKDGFKISVTKRHYSTIVVTVLQSPLKFSSEKKDINNFYIERLENENEKIVFGIISKIVNRVTGGSYNRNENDPGADYSDYNFYQDFSIGQWNKPCVFINN